MKFFRDILVGLATCVAFFGQATTLECRPGTLGSQIPPSQRESLATLTLTGTCGEADLLFLRDSLPALRTLDLSALGCRRLPAYSLFGLPATTLLLPRGLQAVGEGALACSAVEKLALPVGVKSVGRAALSGCRRLKELEIEGPSDLGPGFAADCPELQTVGLAEGITAVPARAFKGCISLTDIRLPASLRLVGDEAFAATGLREVVLPEKLTEIGDYAFAECHKLEAVRLPAAVAALGEGAFMACESLRLLPEGTEAQRSVPTSLTELPSYCFAECPAATPEGLEATNIEAIGAYGLAGHSGTSTVAFPWSLATIGDGAFRGWEALTAIDCRRPQEPPMLGEGVFAGVEARNVTLTVVDTQTALYASLPVWQDFRIEGGDPASLSETAIEASNQQISLVGGFLVSTGAALVSVFSPDGRLLLQGPSPLSVASLSPGLHIATVPGASLKFLRR